MKSDADLYWDKTVAANKALADPATVIKLKSASFATQLRKAFEAGKKVGFRQGHNVGRLSKVTDAEKNVLDDLFNQFGD